MNLRPSATAFQIFLTAMRSHMQTITSVRRVCKIDPLFYGVKSTCMYLPESTCKLHHSLFVHFSVRHVGAGQISPRGVLLSISKILVYTNRGFVSCNFIGQASFTWKPALSFCHFKSGGQEGDIEKQKFYLFYYLFLTF